MKNLKVGDVVRGEDGNERTVLEKLTQTVLFSIPNNPEVAFDWYHLNELKDYTLVEPEEQWSCGKCDREAKGINDSEIPNHFRTCPKASVQPEKTLEEKFREYALEEKFREYAKEYSNHINNFSALQLAQIAEEHYKDKQD